MQINRAETPRRPFTYLRDAVVVSLTRGRSYDMPAMVRLLEKAEQLTPTHMLDELAKLAAELKAEPGLEGLRSRKRKRRLTLL